MTGKKLEFKAGVEKCVLEIAKLENKFSERVVYKASRIYYDRVYTTKKKAKKVTSKKKTVKKIKKKKKV